MFFWNSLAFWMIQRMLAIWSLVPLPFLNWAGTSGSSRFMYCWSLAWRVLSITLLAWGFPMAQLVKNLPAVRETGFDPWVGKIPGEGKGYPLQYSGLENSIDCKVHEVAKSWTWLSDFHFYFTSEWDECNCTVFEHSLHYLSLGLEGKLMFPVLWPLLSFPNLLT